MPRYTPSNCMGRNVQVFLDGESQENVLEADDELGFIVQIETDANGNAVREGYSLKRILRTGKVLVAFTSIEHNAQTV
ncbi:hypothetical protein [Epibacterium ulvae]|uniref:hypothetical protein n=1 Tax=Epibacterium ulvae TaxID=1156985 RepID=UPI0024936DAF|nr:hypothetical protein [Epibacterium ulvae]